MSVNTLRPGITLRTAEGMLNFIHGYEDREVWIQVGQALKGEFGTDAFESWVAWSEQASNFSAKACQSSWRGFKSNYSIGTIIKFAREGGYTFDKSDQPTATPAEVARKRMERINRVEAEKAERRVLAANAQTRALADWRASDTTGQSDYAKRKGIDLPESVRFIAPAQGGGLVVPMVRYDLPKDQALKGLQFISDDGSKKFTFGMEKPGAACRLGTVEVGAPIFICEGYATGMSLRMALERQWAVFVAFDAYNLPVVCEAVHKANPSSALVICADDDYLTQVGGRSHNVGRIQAQIALDAVMDAGAKLVCRTYPIFSAKAPRGAKDTDFNDLARLEGLAEVRSQLDVCFEALERLEEYV